LPCIIIRGCERGYSDLKGVLSGPLPELFMHELGHGCNLGDEAYESSIGGTNISRDEGPPPWQSLLERKVKGIATTRVTPRLYRGEEQDCIMRTVKAGVDYGPLCASGVITYVRGRVPLIEEAPEEAPISLERKSTDQVGIVLKLSRSTNYTPRVTAWYRTAEAREADVLTYNLREKRKLTADSFKDWSRLDGKMTDAVTYRVTSTLGIGAHVVAIVAQDPNPAVLLDPDHATVDDRVYRVDVTE
jgi:hypothetical protein